MNAGANSPLEGDEIDHGAVNSVVKKTDAESRTTLSTSDKTSIHPIITDRSVWSISK